MEERERLEMDGLIGVFVPRNREDFQYVDHQSYSRAITAMYQAVKTA